MNVSLFLRMTEECARCKAARQDVARLWNALASRRGLVMIVRRADEDGKVFGEEIRAAQPTLHCEHCDSFGRVLTTEGLELAQWLESVGLITATQLQRAIGAALASRSAEPQGDVPIAPDVSF